MDFWDLVPFIVGAIYLFGRGKGKETPKPTPKPNSSRPKSTPSEPSFEEVLRELMGDQSRQPKVQTEPAPVTKPETKWQDQRETTFERPSFDTPVKKKKAKTVVIENIETKAWSYDDQIEDEIVEKKRQHHEIDRHMAVDEIGLKSDEIDLRNAIIYDAIFRRPEH